MLQVQKKPATPQRQYDARAKVRKPFVLPEAGNDEKHVYVRTLRTGSPFSYITIGGVTFDKRCLSSHHSLRSFEGHIFDPIIPTIELTEKQAEAYSKRAEEVELTIPSRPNPDYEPGDPDNPFMLQRQPTLASEHIILRRFDEFTREEIAKIKRELESYEQPPLDETVGGDPQDKFKKELVKQQSKKGK